MEAAEALLMSGTLNKQAGMVRARLVSVPHHKILHTPMIYVQQRDLYMLCLVKYCILVYFELFQTQFEIVCPHEF